MPHIPVLLGPVVELLAPPPGAAIIDGTLGAAGHAVALLKAAGPAGRLLGLDADPEAVARSSELLAVFGDRAAVRHSSFRNLTDIARESGFRQVQVILLDLGVSSFQLDEPQRGFSFLSDGPLDMRMDSEAELTAAEIVNDWPQEELANIIFRYGDESRSRRVARAIVDARPLSTTGQLADVVARALGGHRGQRIHPATKVFQALRIAVNDELAALQDVLPQAVGLLEPGGRLGVISFHSLEDRIVKHFFQRESRDCICEPEPGSRRAPLVCRCNHHATLEARTHKPVTAGEAEVRENPRSRSAKLRVAERLPDLGRPGQS